ncbi:MAG: hypothetical protein FD157_4062 [Rhodocyclaceae bacterium]|nr:MAG: hypothetical protein FD157_4062 [Rhodocyclaceae bacterium]TNC98016.1 MAG: hypothetical protein FD118_4085 [Rhodocyclaceae bacterium]
MNEDVRFHLSREAKRKIYSATITAVIVVLTVGQRHAGFLLILGALPLAVWLTWSAWVIVRRPYARLGQLICVAVWLLALALLAGIHYVWHQSVRRDANEIVKAINAYSASYGRCPNNIDNFGIKREVLEEKLGDNYSYACNAGKAKLSYVATFTIFDTYAYDFEKDVWVYESWADKKKFADTRPPGTK